MENRERKTENKHRLNLSVFICVYLCIIFLAFSAYAQQNGKDAKWESAGKQGVGTALSVDSKVWFTLQGGSLTEVYYPTADNANVQLLQFVVVNPKMKTVETERDDTNHEIKVLRNDSLSFQQINTAKSGKWKLKKTYTINPENNSILIDIWFEGSISGYIPYIYYDPSLNNSGMKDTAWTQNNSFLASDGNISSALICNLCKFGEMTNNFVGVNDGLEQLKSNFSIKQTSPKVENGNVVQFARIEQAVIHNNSKLFKLS